MPACTGTYDVHMYARAVQQQQQQQQQHREPRDRGRLAHWWCCSECITIPLRGMFEIQTMKECYIITSPPSYYLSITLSMKALDGNFFATNWLSRVWDECHGFENCWNRIIQGLIDERIIIIIIIITAFLRDGIQIVPNDRSRLQRKC
mmetsp:Transcript_9981/g.24047  ORF Transcript_9981/g.24047 Transcript_9981/m.24047 type:complete len:148 (+) Transcript_9981:653-1096(+)